MGISGMHDADAHIGCYDDHLEWTSCEQCGGQSHTIGFLGNVEWFECRDCGWKQAGECDE